ncbi:MAG: hypothetical protein ACK4UX_06320 [Thiobacillus sp.]
MKRGLLFEAREFTGRSLQFERETQASRRPELFRLPDDIPEIAAPS